MDYDMDHGIDILYSYMVKNMIEMDKQCRQFNDNSIDVAMLGI